MNENISQQAKAPEGTNTEFEAQIFSMPERYQHGAEASLIEPRKAEKKIVQSSTAPPPPPPPPPPKPQVMAKKGGMSTTTKIILISGGVFIVLLLVFAGYIFFGSQEETTTTATTTQQSVSRPAPEPEPAPEPTPEPEPEPQPQSPFDIQVTPGTDSDSDGLSDVEENGVYKTNARMPDTDNDGFLDGNEVFHRYNPGGTAPGTLLESGLVLAYQGEAGLSAYEIYYPSVWKIEKIENELVIDAKTGEGFRITSEIKLNTQSIATWVEEYVGLEDYLETQTKNGLNMVQSENQLMAYVDLGNGVLILKYDTGTKTRVDYLQTFQMMLNSIRITGVATPQGDTESFSEAKEDEGELSEADAEEVELEGREEAEGVEGIEEEVSDEIEPEL